MNVTHFRNVCKRGGDGNSTYVPSEADCGACRHIMKGYRAVEWGIHALELHRSMKRFIDEGGQDPDNAARQLRAYTKGIAECAHRQQVHQYDAVRRSRESLAAAIDALGDALAFEEKAQQRLTQVDQLIKRATRSE